MNIQKEHIPLKDTGYFLPVVSHYLEGDEKLIPFYKYRPDLNSFKDAISDFTKTEFPRNVLAGALIKQYAATGISDKIALSNIESLKEKNTFTVTTGHQLNLFTGPLYFFYKIITTINLAEELKKKYPEYNFIPVYWMASEDHDFEEISNVNLFGKKITWGQPQKGAVGNISTESLKEIFTPLKEVMGNSPFSETLYTLLETSYLKHQNLSEATRFLVHNLFGKYGLVVIDGNDTELKKEFISFFKNDIFNENNCKLVNETIDKMVHTDIISKNKIQVHPRDINLFYMREGTRERIEKAGSNATVQYKVVNTGLSFSEEELLIELDNHPERFSPNVTLRPLYQQTILPNLAYIGGPAEISYWLEYKAMFDFNKVNFPVLMLRNSVLWIDESQTEKIKKVNVTSAELFLDTDALIKKVIERNTTDPININDELEKLNHAYAGIEEKAGSLDVTLKPSVNAELQKALNGLRSIEAKLIKAEKQKHETLINQITKIKVKLFPGNSLQERYDNFIPYYLKYGEEFISILKENLNPFDSEMLILSAKE